MKSTPSLTFLSIFRISGSNGSALAELADSDVEFGRVFYLVPVKVHALVDHFSQHVNQRCRVQVKDGLGGGVTDRRVVTR